MAHIIYKTKTVSVYTSQEWEPGFILNNYKLTCSERSAAGMTTIWLRNTTLSFLLEYLWSSSNRDAVASFEVKGQEKMNFLIHESPSFT